MCFKCVYCIFFTILGYIINIAWNVACLCWCSVQLSTCPSHVHTLQYASGKLESESETGIIMCHMLVYVVFIVNASPWILVPILMESQFRITDLTPWMCTPLRIVIILRALKPPSMKLQMEENLRIIIFLVFLHVTFIHVAISILWHHNHYITIAYMTRTFLVIYWTLLPVQTYKRVHFHNLRSVILTMSWGKLWPLPLLHARKLCVLC